MKSQRPGKRRIKKAPVAIFLGEALVTDEEALYRMFAAECQNRTRHQLRELNGLFALDESERQFAAELLTMRPDLWIYRCNQKRACGDFLVVDPRQKRVWAVELKAGKRLRLSAAGCGGQLRHAHLAVTELAQTTEAFPDVAPRKIVGDPDSVSEHLRTRTDVPEPVLARRPGFTTTDLGASS